jgi:tRNA(fMet)-specific endonuclease VapC
MTRYLLDTDHVTLHAQGHAALRAKMASVPPEDLATSAVTVEETLRGRLAVLARRLGSEERIEAYARPVQSVRFFSTVPVLPFDRACEDRFQDLRSRRPRVGAQDLKIAATALAHNLVLVTRNRKDFGRVPGLTLEDWSAG